MIFFPPFVTPSVLTDGSSPGVFILLPPLWCHPFSAADPSKALLSIRKPLRTQDLNHLPVKSYAKGDLPKHGLGWQAGVKEQGVQHCVAG